MVKQKKTVALVAPEVDENLEKILDAYKNVNDKQREFCKLYVHDWNATEAYVKSFGGKRETARQRASELLRLKKIKLYCEHLNENLELTTGVSRSWVMEQHLKLVRASIAHLHNTWIDRKDFDQLTEDQKCCIQEITTQTRREVAEQGEEEVEIQVDYVKLKLYDKQKALDAITRMMGYDKAQRLDITSGGRPLGLGGTTVNVQINIYNTAPPLAKSEKDIQD